MALPAVPTARRHRRVEPKATYCLPFASEPAMQLLMVIESMSCSWLFKPGYYGFWSFLEDINGNRHWPASTQHRSGRGLQFFV